MYGSHWTEACDKRFKNDILIVLTQEPLIVVAKGCMYVQLDMFTKVSYNYILYTHYVLYTSTLAMMLLYHKNISIWLSDR